MKNKKLSTKSTPESENLLTQQDMTVQNIKDDKTDDHVVQQEQKVEIKNIEGEQIQNDSKSPVDENPVLERAEDKSLEQTDGVDLKQSAEIDLEQPVQEDKQLTDVEQSKNPLQDSIDASVKESCDSLQEISQEDIQSKSDNNQTQQEVVVAEQKNDKSEEVDWNYDSTAISSKSQNPTAGTMINMYTVHFGKILSNLSIVCAALATLCILVPFLTVFYYFIAFFIMILVIICTLGLIFLAEPNFIPSLFTSNDIVNKITEIAMVVLPYLIGISLGAALISIILLAVDKNHKNTTRIVISSFMLGFAVLFVILLIVGVIASA